MGKVKTVVMGDIAAEEKARERAEAKRAQKKAEKEKTKEAKEDKKDKEKLREETSVPEEPEKSVPADISETPTAQPAKSSESSEKSEKKPKTKKVESRYVSIPGKKYLAAKGLVDPKKIYPLSEAIELVKKTSLTSFDGSVEVHLNLTEKNLRGSASLPHGTGREVRVKIADDALISELEKSGKIDFDILVASPDMMPKLAKIAKILGPKGLMPNPKTNTISSDPKGLAASLAKGQVQWKTQPDFPIVHAVIGKTSFEDKKLAENLAALLKAIGKDKIVSAFLKATMGPSVKVTV